MPEISHVSSPQLVGSVFLLRFHAAARRSAVDSHRETPAAPDDITSITAARINP
jgi:hypothetical protein